MCEAYKTFLKANVDAALRTAKLLGVTVNDTLTWSDHIKTVKRKVQKNIGILYRIRSHLAYDCAVSLYFTLLHPYFDYCNIVWAVQRSTLLNKLFICQKIAIRTVTNSKGNARTKPLFVKLRILSIFDVNNLQVAVACYMYRSINNLLPQYFCRMFTQNFNCHTHNTRQHHHVHITRHRLNVRRNTVHIFKCVCPKKDVTKTI